MSTGIQWTGRRLGRYKHVAARVGLSVEAYAARVDAGEKWCTGCRSWHPKSEFPVDRSRYDGLRARCLSADRGRPRGTRDPMREKARSVVMHAVRSGRLPRPTTVACVDCGHVWREGERRHEYDHWLGYEPEHYLDVQAVCTLCHADREKRRVG